MNATKLLNRFIIIVSSFFLCFAFICFLYSLIVPNEGDPYVGSFNIYSMDDGWTLTISGEDGSYEISLPVSKNDLIGKTVHLKRILPDNIDNGMNLCVRSSMNDTFIYVNGAIRSAYSTAGYYNMSYNLPSAYMFCDLTKEDAGKEIDIKIFLKSTGTINTVYYGYSGNIFHEIHEQNKYIVFVGIIMLFIGFITILIYLVLSRRSEIPGFLLYIGELTLTLGLWLLSESRLKQWILASQAPTGIYAYITIEIITVFACLYFDSVQEKRYHKIFLICETVSLSVLVINSLLALTGLCDYYQTLLLSHICSLITMVLTVFTFIRDIVRRRTLNYRAILVGIALFILCCLGELVNFYINRLGGLGLYLAIGIILLLVCTIIQVVLNEIKRNAETLKDQERFALMTLEAFAGSIDARDVYTGGHSYRVAEYASKLAEAVASKYHFTSDDIKEIHYIGLMHDIGKVALPDSILNCTGKLTEEEFSLVKQHVVIGEQLLISLKHSQNLLDGVRYHHERYDGTGYPDGLSGQDIPVIARIICIADSYDAMTSERVFREPMTGAMAKAELIACSGSQFDPELAEIFCSLIDRKIIFPIGSEGIEQDEKGIPLQSAMLQYLLRQNTLSEENNIIKEPSHIRTACFIASMAEKNNSKVDIYLMELSGANIKPEQIKDYLCRCASLHDLILDYSADSLVLIFIDRTDSDIADILSEASAIAFPGELYVKRLSLT